MVGTVRRPSFKMAELIRWSVVRNLLPWHSPTWWWWPGACSEEAACTTLLLVRCVVGAAAGRSQLVASSLLRWGRWLVVGLVAGGGAGSRCWG